MLSSTIRKASSSFLKEALASPRMLEDLAAMERYMSESYDGRTFVELVQNADDAGSSRLAVRLVEDYLVVANDGRPFNEQDLEAICRSGASKKLRGETIGYRGVGFKSATSISTEIVIRSAGCCFTFSKSICARQLNIPEDKVPTVRIPFQYETENLTSKVRDAIGSMEQQGFTTFFIFAHPDLLKVRRELSDIDAGWLLFLRHLTRVDISCDPIGKAVSITREMKSSEDCLIKVCDSNQYWYVVSDGNASAAFRFDDAKGLIPCEREEAVLHCYLPTLDKTGFPFKVNADFSTDPSRKHIIQDSCTNEAMQKIQSLLSRLILRVVNEGPMLLFPLITLVQTHTALSPLATNLETGTLEKMKAEAWVPQSINGATRPSSIQLLPKWLNNEEKVLIAETDPFRVLPIVSQSLLNEIPKLEMLLMKLGAVEVSPVNFSHLLETEFSASEVPPALVGKIVSYCFRISGLEEKSISDIFVPLEGGGFGKLSTLPKESVIESTCYSMVKEILNEKELTAISVIFPAFSNLTTHSEPREESHRSYSSKQCSLQAPIVSRWKTPIQNCIAIETKNGHAVRKAPGNCKEYDAMSTDSDGVTSYLLAKTVGHLGDSFKLTEDEYEAAARHGSLYRVYVFAKGPSDIDYEIIEDPVRHAKTSRVVKEWEWVFENYAVTQKPDESEDAAISEEDSEESAIDNLDNLTGGNFEKACARLLLRNGYGDISLTKTTGDQGIDIVAYKDGIKYGIQCKCYSSDVGNDAVQEVSAGKVFYGCNLGIVMTNRHFTQGAIQLAKATNVILWDRDVLMSMLSR